MAGREAEEGCGTSKRAKRWREGGGWRRKRSEESKSRGRGTFACEKEHMLGGRAKRRYAAAPKCIGEDRTRWAARKRDIGRREQDGSSGWTDVRKMRANLFALFRQERTAGSYRFDTVIRILTFVSRIRNYSVVNSEIQHRGRRGKSLSAKTVQLKMRGELMCQTGRLSGEIARF